jgi:4-hydroxy-tetrahydrodipicolinate synthase
MCHRPQTAWQDDTMSTDPLWHGVAVALVTLFDSDGGVDHGATAELASYLVGSGVRGVLVAGTTGEADALTDTERVTLITAVRQALPDRVPVLAGASGAWTGASVARVVAAVQAGADAVLVAPPRRCPDVTKFYAEIAAAAGATPVLAYHFPGVAGGEVPVDALASLPVAGVKDSTGDAERLLRSLAAWDGWTYVGSSALATLAGVLGASGAILALANVAPEQCVAAFDGDGAAQRWLLEGHLAAGSNFPHGLKAMVAHRFGVSTAARMG